MDTITIIFDLLKQSGRSQKEFADYLGVGKQLITEWKSGRVGSHIKYVDKIADYFGVTVDYLLGKEDIEKALSSGNESALPIELKDMLMKFRILSPQAREDMIRYLGYLAQRDSQDNE